MEKSKGTVMATPSGELHWAFVNGKGKLNYDEDGYDYCVDIHLRGEDALDFISRLEHELGEVTKGFKIKSMGFRPLVEEEQEDGITKLVTKPFKEIPPLQERNTTSARSGISIISKKRNF